MSVCGDLDVSGRDEIEFSFLGMKARGVGRLPIFVVAGLCCLGIASITILIIMHSL